jgi:flagellar hook-basal body complex protein FliE|tara:strand:+ start:130 stop:480 length:351 start_codon:yes stop_codon:yes gene_type:complete
MEIKSEANALLSQIRDYQSQIADSRNSGISETNNRGVENSTSFGTEMSKVITDTLNGISEAQNNAYELSNAYQAGEDVPLTEVILEMQKSSLAFEATLQVRNKVLQAYEQIMNMPV